MDLAGCFQRRDVMSFDARVRACIGALHHGSPRRGISVFAATTEINSHLEQFTKRSTAGT